MSSEQYLAEIFNRLIIRPGRLDAEAVEDFERVPYRRGVVTVERGLYGSTSSVDRSLSGSPTQGNPSAFGSDSNPYALIGQVPGILNDMFQHLKRRVDGAERPGDKGHELRNLLRDVEDTIETVGTGIKDLAGLVQRLVLAVEAPQSHHDGKEGDEDEN